MLHFLLELEWSLGMGIRVCKWHKFQQFAYRLFVSAEWALAVIRVAGAVFHVQEYSQMAKSFETPPSIAYRATAMNCRTGS